MDTVTVDRCLFEVNTNALFSEDVGKNTLARLLTVHHIPELFVTSLGQDTTSNRTAALGISSSLNFQ